jgi:hypothetical protein
MENPKETTHPKTETRPDVETPTQAINDTGKPAVVPNLQDKEHKEPEKKIA